MARGVPSPRQHEEDGRKKRKAREQFRTLDEPNSSGPPTEDSRKDASTQANTFTKEVKPPMTFSSIRTDSHLVALTGIGLLQLLRNITKEFVEVRQQLSCRWYCLSDADVVLMVMIKLYHNTSFNFLAVVFNVHRTTVSNLFVKDLLSLLASYVRQYFSHQDIQGKPTYLSTSKKFGRTRVVLDCTEVPIEKAKDLQSRMLTYRQYKKGHTAKVLIGCAPSGLINFVSESYGRRASDCEITGGSGVLNLCTAFKDEVMVDKGFLIDTLCSDVNLELTRPPFLKKQKQMSEADALRNKEIVRPRVHVERAIQRLNAYKILQQKSPVHMLPHFYR
ncbi:uncharacterized protein LOC135389506 [Ornithodoros turicata]|uniref:uncharacterized protein LOC135389506 n=1 Tax=Ornithodoros turicata TaxID=34597 RepID=UPI003139EDBB